MRRTLALGAALWGAACAPAPRAPACPPASPPAAATSSAPPAAAPAPAEPPATGVRVLLRPVLTPTPAILVEVNAAADAPLTAWHMGASVPERVSELQASDARGAIDVKLDGASLRLGRAPSGPVTLRYRVRANDDSPANPLGQLVLEDRMRASGEGLLFLPDDLDDASVSLAVQIDGGALHAPNAASTFGVGPGRRTKARVQALRHSTFLAGAMGVAVFDAPDGHDEAAWLGYTAFDPRAAAGEIAHVRSAMGELFGSRDEPPQTVFFFAQARPSGSFTTSPRAGGMLVQLGPSEPWSAPLRLSLAHQMVRRWLGGELAFAGGDALWFTEGVARFAATRVLARAGLLSPDEARSVIAGEMSVLVTSPHRGKSDAELTALARSEPTARAHLTARGALYATRLHALLRAQSKGQTSLEAILKALLSRARAARAPLPIAAWTEELTKLLPGEARSYEATITRGQEPTLPAGALGPCFRDATADYTGFDLGFDPHATLVSPARRVVGVRQGGPADKAGLRDGDAIEEVAYTDSRADVPVKATVVRDGAKVRIQYLPGVGRHRGQAWTRVTGVDDDRCGDVP